MQPTEKKSVQLEVVIESTLETVRFKTKRGEFLIHITELDTLKITSGRGEVLNVQPNANNSIDIFGSKYTGGRL
jgi:hypothetical protein